MSIRSIAELDALYREGGDGVNWHADDNPGMGTDPTIASLSFGATRRFDIRDRHTRATALELELHAGDLVIMRGDLQHTHEHRVPREPQVTAPRINLTFRALPCPAPQPTVAHRAAWCPGPAIARPNNDPRWASHRPPAGGRSPRRPDRRACWPSDHAVRPARA